ncbi:M23 family metallopeptidase [Enterovirga sp.]|uniref:M23 family metallopeptidase n=1 Tax=Enterovirga sp. TaxID=2026350 RepID=UPI00261BC241|nr:M23 family metallopeptidase [Enterovirga sp.]MDB5590049.1 peptidase [Enterovirga sp.]
MSFHPSPYRLAFSGGAPDTRGGAARLARGAWQLGNDPALDLDSPSAPTGRHALSFRWLGASVLTALAGTLLIGSAIYVSSQGEVTFAAPAEPAPAAGGRANAGGGLRKGDKLVRAETVAAAKQSYRAPMTLRSGDREVIKVRSFTRISTGLSLTSGVYATNIPAFNPMRFFASAEAERGVEPPPEAFDAEVSVVKTDLSTMLLEPAGPGLTDADVLAQLEAEARSSEQAGRLSAALPTFLPRAFATPVGAAAGSPGLFPRTSDPTFRSIEVRVVPENVTNLPKSAARAGEVAFEDRTVTVKRGETLDAALRGAAATAEEARQIVGALGGRDRTAEGLHLRLLLAPPTGPGQPRAVLRAVLYGERGIEAIAAMNDRGAFVSVAPPPAETGRPDNRPGQDEEEEETEGSGARLYDSLYETALKHDLPRQTVEDLVRIFGYDVDFQRRVSPGDSFEIFFAAEDEGGDRAEILSAALTLGSDVRRIFRYQAEDGSVDYLDEAGRSLKKFLVRKPILDARMSSGFGSRSHPVLGYAKMHTGVDWAARIGQPILAAGNGTVTKAGWDGGYGRRIEIQHTNGYVTTYNHQSAFARGIAPGMRVRQGQVIGFVGSTGLSTGPHLHYEVVVNGRFVDPMKIRVPRGRELDGRALQDFGRQRDQIDALSKRAASNQLAASEAR